VPLLTRFARLRVIAEVVLILVEDFADNDRPIIPRIFVTVWGETVTVVRSRVGAMHMHITVLAHCSGLPHMTPITCNRCEASAPVVTAQLDIGQREVIETRTYRCESCGHMITQKVDS
jgi:DNA-directed RNA polymerase subunit RPC12/RpoP